MFSTCVRDISLCLHFNVSLKEKRAVRSSGRKLQAQAFTVMFLTLVRGYLPIACRSAGEATDTVPKSAHGKHVYLH